MNRRYSQHEIEKWADYSGDRNRVHFDKEFAIENGLSDVIVQGMLILLDAKIMMSSCIESSSMLNFYIKKPVTIDTDINYSLKDRGSKKILTVTELNDPDEICVTATALPQKPMTLTPGSNQIHVTPEFVQGHLDTLKKYYPGIEANWLLMDTILFCICFNQQKDDYFYRQSLKIAKDNRQDKITTYHVAQKIFASERILTCHDIDFSAISYVIEEKDIYIQADSAYSTFNVNAFEADEVIFQSSIGCITKSFSN
ncbi:MaoC/PaaZ C-terminal domain-containing protein [Serratia sp. NPDC078593]|uniref:MaoC/PaaZ C-terminal domain-containing protein n=1 Tax=unclassified Serratia (in: enterobacteria) TaxID=2647522 RepID=UPI0037D2BFC4